MHSALSRSSLFQLIPLARNGKLGISEERRKRRGEERRKEAVQEREREKESSVIGDSCNDQLGELRELSCTHHHTGK